jgi:hypothetical protein
MSRRKVKLTSINGVAAGQTATLDLPCGGRRYFGIYAKYKTNAAQATLEADITEIRLVINGKVQRRFSDADLNFRELVNGRAFVLGMIPINLYEPRAREANGEEGVAWGTADVNTFRVEFDIAGGAVAPTISAWAEVDDVPSPLGLIVKWYKETYNATGAQTLNITTLSKRDVYQAIHARTALVTAVKVTVDGLDWYDLARDEASLALPRRPGLTQVANNFSVLFEDDDQVSDGLPMLKKINGATVAVSELRVDLTASGAGAIPLLIERLGYAD